MSLQGKILQTVDTMDVLFKLPDGITMFSGATSKADLETKVDSLDLYAGIGQGKLCSLKTKKDQTVDVSLVEFNLDLFAAVNGVAIDKTSTGSYYMNKSFAITTLSATVTGATRILAVRNPTDGSFLKIVSGSPANINEVKVTGGTTLTFFTGFLPTTCLVSYEAPATALKDNWTITFDAISFPKAGEFLATCPVFDSATESAVADAYMNFYNCELDGNYTYSFTMGKNIETPMKLSILVPNLLPDGTVNTAKKVGKFVVTER